MKIKLLLTLLGMGSSASLLSQEPLPRPFVKLNNGTLIHGSTISYESQLFRSGQLKLDSLSFRERDVKFYGDTKGNVFANLNGFVQDIGGRKGVCFFRTMSTTNSTQTFAGSSYSKTNTNTITKYFFTENLGELRRVRYLAFKDKMQDDSLAKRFIHSAGRARATSLISYAAAGGACALNFALLGNEAYLNSNFIFVLGGVALGGVITGIVYNKIKLKRTQRALYQYYMVFITLVET
jgi:hypothetical protein